MVSFSRLKFGTESYKTKTLLKIFSVINSHFKVFKVSQKNTCFSGFSRSPGLISRFSRIQGQAATLSNLTPHTKFTSSSRNTEFKDVLPWNVSQMITKTISISNRIVISYTMKRGISFSVWQKVNGNKTTTWSEFPNWGKTIAKQILGSEERNISKRARLWKSQSGIQVEKLTIWVRSFEFEKL